MINIGVALTVNGYILLTIKMKGYKNGYIRFDATLEAKPGKEKELENLLKSSLELAQKEPKTVSWYAIKLNDKKFGIFDSFNDEDGRTAHLNGEIAKAVMQKAPELLANDPQIEKIDILAAKQ